ncbi:enoyl-CoA hydratase/isomerase family protein [Alicyclobacillus sp. SO9]|uniref:enoyl-CoA hydratase/isomerase family protein n=1 Tax=Alicyclobacillus sp. SO9 TaxID=2665646 RepID=UPI0018E724FD|nr:enoyl-CoA hydratase-related protein [Alicyclobacillus sp. SO9]QQE78825.1 enoyl-CoA hydratase/isomerase family protein [Alicyclobacillus sp. SO9]
MALEQAVTLSVAGPVATLTLQRPKQMNALNRQVLEELLRHVEMLKQTPEVRAVILRGEGKAFAAGADIKEMQDLTAVEAQSFSELGQTAFRGLEQLHCPTIALIQGYALGGGLELAMACDIRIAAKGAKFGQPEIGLGVITGFGGSQRLPRIVGQGRALSMLLTGDLVDTDEAFAIGLVTQVAEPDDLHERGEKLAQKLAKLAPKAVNWMKKAVYEGAEADLTQGLSMEAAWFGLAFGTEDQTEGMTAFVEKRKPEFRGK